MSCRKCVNTSNEQFCARCGAFLTSKKRILREPKFLHSPQSDISDILSNLRLRQHKISFFPQNYLSTRPSLIDFIFEQGEEFELSSLTQHISIYLMDYVHSLSEIPRVLHKAVSFSCILIACKSEESEKIPKNCEVYGVNANLKAIELEVLSILGWKLHVSTVLHFIEFYSAVGFIFEDEVFDLRCVKVARKFAVLICELCIGECRFAKVFPEELAVCCLAAARRKVGVPDVWNEALLGLSGKQPDSYLLSEIYDLYSKSFPE